MVYKSVDHGKIVINLLSNMKIGHKNLNLYSVSFDHKNHSYYLSVDTLSAKPFFHLLTCLNSGLIATSLLCLLQQARLWPLVY